MTMIMALRSHRHRHRPRRLCLRHPRGAARPEDRRGREARHLRRHLPQCRLHPVEGAAARFGALRGSRARASREMGIEVGKPSSICRRMIKYKEAKRRRQRQGRRRSCSRRTRSTTFHGTGRIAAPGQGRGERRRRQDADARDQEHRHRHRLGRRARFPASRSTRSASCPRPARSSCRGAEEAR